MSGERGKDASVGFAPGTKIGKYEVRERLGIGGQAIVYKAYDSWLDRYVAIKQISSHLAADPKFLERFRREAQILAKIGTEEPAIVTIHELIQDEKGLFIVMEYVAGHTLETTLADNPGPVEPKAVLAILWRLAGGLNAVHAAGILHRDIKPGNLIVGESLKVKITDFGVAASTGGQTSMVLGTTKYMAPELYEGKNVDARADLYSLGFIAYEMLLGRAKFNEIFVDIVRDHHSESLRWMKWHGNAQVQAPPLHEVDPTIPVALSELVGKMIAKDPAQRFESMEMLGRAIKANFSPRAHAARETQAAEKAGSGASGESTVNVAAIPGGGSELEIPSDGPATAPIPKKRMTLKTKLILAGAASVVAMVVLAIVIANGMTRRETLQREAKDKFEAASTAYREGRFDESSRGFEDTARYGQSDEAAKASVLVHLAKAQKAVEDAVKAEDEKLRRTLWELAANEQDVASKQLKKVQGAKPNLYEWTTAAAKNIANFEVARVSTRGICDAIAKATDLMDRKKFAEATVALNEGLNNRQIQPTAAQEEQLLQFRRKLAAAELDFNFQAHMEQGLAAVKDKKFDQAKIEFSKAGELLGTESATLMVAPAKIEEYKQQLQKAQKQLAGLSIYVDAMARAKQAQTDKDKAKELSALQEALSVQPSPELKDQIQTLQARIAVDEGVKLVSEGNLDGARAAFEKSLKIKETAEAQKQLDNLKKTLTFSGYVGAAEAAFEKGDFKAAMEKYQQAAQADPSNGEVQAKIHACEYNLKLIQAKALGDQKKFAEAYALLDDCRKLLPDKAAEVDALYGEIKQNREHDECLAAGNQLMKSRQWSRAREEFNKAKKIKANRETDDLIKQSYYQENLALGTSSMDQNNFADARAYFKVAQSYLNTEEIKNLIAQMEQKLKENK